MNKDILLVGGNGFLGTHLHTALENSGEYAVTSPTHTELDILDPVQVSAYVKSTDIVVNLTGQVRHPIEECLLQNSQGILNLCIACEDSGAKLVQLSSVLTVGAYAESKQGAEELVQTHLQQTQYLILRLSNLYGPGQIKGLFWYLLESFKKGRLEIKDNDGTLRRNFLHVEDAAAIITQLLLTNAQGVYNLASPDYYSIVELVSLIEQVAQKKFPATYAAVPPNENTEKIDIRKITQTIDLSFAHGVQQFFTQELVKHHESNRSRHP